MNTPKTNELEKFLIESNASSDLGKFQRMTGHARQLETQVNELREALVAATNQLSTAYEDSEDAAAAYGVTSDIQKARAILEKTK